MSRKKRLQYKDLDGMRFIAFVPIFLYCAFYLFSSEDNPIATDTGKALEFIKQNSLDFFFFLSSFLITSHGLREYKYNERYSLKNFLIRRFMRIIPVFFLAILFTFLIHPWIIKLLDLTPIIVPKGSDYLTLFPNYFSNLTSEQYIYLAIVWTIYMFIQFYVFWGLVLKFFVQQIKVIAGILVLVGIVSRVFHVFNETSFEFDTLSAGIPIGIGAIIAQQVRNNDRLIELVKHLSKGTIGAIYLIGLVVLIGGYLFLGGTYMAAVIPIITSFFFGFVIMEQTYGKNSFFKLRKSKLISRLGKISYGLIVYSSIIMVLGIISVVSLGLEMNNIGIQVAFLVIAFLLSWICADISYNNYESPILRIKREFKQS